MKIRAKIVMNVKRIFIAALLTGFISVGGHAADIEGVYFEPVFKRGDIEMNLQGLGSKSVLLMKAFVAAFYIEGDLEENPMADIPKHLEVEYFVKISAEKLTRYTVDRMAKNTSKKEMAVLAGELELMSRLFVDLAPGDRFALTYIPEVGTEFSYNGKITGVVEGEKFAKVLFAVWIGDKPFDKQLKNQILGLEEALSNDKLALNETK